MILAFEMTWTGGRHAPINSATLQTAASAFPDQRIHVLAEAGHLDNLRADPALAAYPNLAFARIEVSPHFRHRTHIVSGRRFGMEFATLRRAVRAAPPGEPCLLLLLSATPTAILAAGLVARLARRRRVGAQVALHGNLNDLNAWRSRNPLLRRFDLPAVLEARRQPGTLRYLVFEDGIRRELERLVPGAAARTDVLPHPVNTAEIADVPETPLRFPLRVGLVGQATEEKGITPFLEMARQFRERHGDRVEFHLVGRALPGASPDRFAALAHPVSTEPLSREAFTARLARLHFVALPLAARYYSLSASGALVDAITWLKPVIATRLPIVAGEFDRFGDLGHLCDGVEAMRAALEGVVAAMDAGRYGRQREAMRRARAARMPEALARRYGAIVREGFAGILRP